MSILIAKITLSFIVGFIWIAGVSFLAEKFGPKVGGLIAGIPATMVISLFFIGVYQGSLEASSSTTIIPLVLAVNAFFVVVYICISKVHTKIVSLLGVLIFWFFLTWLLHFLPTTEFISNVLFSLVGIFISYLVLKKIVPENSYNKKIKYTTTQVIWRGCVGGGTVAFAIVMSKLFGPVVGGIFASFPALTVAMIMILSQTQSKEFVALLLRYFIISGTINVLLFVIAARVLFSTHGIYIGTLVALTCSLVYTYGVHTVNKYVLGNS